MVAKLDWPTKRLRTLAEFRNGVNYNKSSFGEGVKVVGVSNFQDYSKPSRGLTCLKKQLSESMGCGAEKSLMAQQARNFGFM